LGWIGLGSVRVALVGVFWLGLGWLWIYEGDLGAPWTYLRFFWDDFRISFGVIWGSLRDQVVTAGSFWVILESPWGHFGYAKVRS
jgi:hypothetical protein